MKRVGWLILLVACAAKAPLTASLMAEDLDFGTTPRLQPTAAGAYVGGPVVVRDPVIGPLLERRLVDAGLMAAASSLALSVAEERGGAARWELREALWRAGWAHGVHDARTWTTTAGKAPPADVFAWLDALGADEPIGLARARGKEWDAWVALRAVRPIPIGAPPRTAVVGTPLTLPTVEGGTWRAADGTGKLQSGSLDSGATLLLTTAGEWLIDLRRGDQELARFPVYVGITAPTEAVLALPDGSGTVSGEADALQLAGLLLARVREEYGRAAWVPNPILDTALDRYLARPGTPSSEALAGLGFPAASSVVWGCDASTVENCIDSWIWDVRRRETLLSDAVDSYGLRAEVDASGIHLTLLLADANL